MYLIALSLLVAVLVVYIAYLVFLIVAIEEAPRKEVLQPLAVALVGLLGVGGALLQLNEAAAKERQQYQRSRDNVTAAVRADILSIMTIVSDAHIPEQFAYRFVHPESRCLWADSARSEDYLTVYRALSAQFGLIDAADKTQVPAKISNVVNFYNYFKAARDATAPLRPDPAPPTVETVRQVSKGVLLLLDKMYLAGFDFLGGGEGQFEETKRILHAFRKTVDANANESNEVLQKIWVKDVVFARIPPSICPRDPAP